MSDTTPVENQPIHYASFHLSEHGVQVVYDDSGFLITPGTARDILSVVRGVLDRRVPDDSDGRIYYGSNHQESSRIVAHYPFEPDVVLVDEDGCLWIIHEDYIDQDGDDVLVSNEKVGGPGFLFTGERESVVDEMDVFLGPDSSDDGGVRVSR